MDVNNVSAAVIGGTGVSPVGEPLHRRETPVPPNQSVTQWMLVTFRPLYWWHWVAPVRAADPHRCDAGATEPKGCPMDVNNHSAAVLVAPASRRSGRHSTGATRSPPNQRVTQSRPPA